MVYRVKHDYFVTGSAESKSWHVRPYYFEKLKGSMNILIHTIHVTENTAWHISKTKIFCSINGLQNKTYTVKHIPLNNNVHCKLYISQNLQSW